MPIPTRETFTARYHYDALDRLVDSTPFEQAAIQRYYCKTCLATELQGAKQHTIVQHEEQLLAQQQREDGKVTATLLATDQQRSVLNTLNATQPNPLAYSPYGHHPLGSGLLSLLGFNGERPDPVTGHYHLGNGYRQFNPVLMRFNSPDSWSPFGKGGFNAYMYCGADPINRSDPTGHFAATLIVLVAVIANVVGIATSVVGAILKDKTIAYTGLGIAFASATSLVGGISYKAFKAGPSTHAPTYNQALAMRRLNRTNSESSVSSSPPESIEMHSMTRTNRVNSSVATSSPTTSDLRFRNSTNEIRRGSRES